MLLNKKRHIVVDLSEDCSRGGLYLQATEINGIYRKQETRPRGTQ